MLELFLLGLGIVAAVIGITPERVLFLTSE